MSYPNIIEFHNEIIDLIYPVGSIYMSTNNVSPSTFLGGEWEQIKDRFLLSAGSTYTAGSTGGESTHTLSIEETPVHTHTRGSMEITGTLRVVGEGNTSSAWTSNVTGTGAFYQVEQLAGTQYYANTVTNTNSGTNYAGFKASKTWSGSTSSVGSGNAHNNMPPYLTVYMWKRTS